MISLFGILLLLGIAYALSSKRSAINWRTVGGAFAIQALLGAFILYVPAGKEMLLSASEFVASILEKGQDGLIARVDNGIFALPAQIIFAGPVGPACQEIPDLGIGAAARAQAVPFDNIARDGVNTFGGAQCGIPVARFHRIKGARQGFPFTRGLRMGSESYPDEENRCK